MHSERIRLRGRVQGVGMRPTLYRLALRHGLRGQVHNDAQGVELCLYATSSAITAFLEALPAALPPLARLDTVERQRLEPSGPAPTGFGIAASPKRADSGGAGAVVLPDAASCPACIAESRDPAQRRYGYPFTNCTHCGPRLSIQNQVPWDRGATSMAPFALCAACAAEYADPADRRFHAEPVACPRCGPHCWLTDAQAVVLAEAASALAAAAASLRAGRIVAIKSLGGFHLAGDARDQALLARLRAGKQRPAKPLAVMVRDLAMLEGVVALDGPAVAALRDVAAPIVLLPRLPGCPWPEALAPGLEQLGVMLPSTPLQHLLFDQLDFPLVMSSGNRSGQPPCTDNAQALRELAGIADEFLLNNRDIVNRVDDSVVQLAAGRPRVLRLARGLAPAQHRHLWQAVPPILAMGAQLKASFALLRKRDWVLSSHIGDLEQAASLQDYASSLRRFCQLYDFAPEHVAVDAHPGYVSHRLGETLAAQHGARLIKVQHHHAHAVACLVEHGLAPSRGPWLAVCLDGLGYGENGELWGGEFLRVDYRGFTRLGRWRPAALIGGTAALREPWRNLYAVIAACGGWARFCAEQADGVCSALQTQPPQRLQAMLDQQINSPLCSSVGRSFDALAALLKLTPARLSFEGEAAMRVQAAAASSTDTQAYPCALTWRDGLLELDWRPMWAQIFADRRQAVSAPTVAARFHQGLAAAIVGACAQLASQFDCAPQVVLCGGVFQNRLLLEACERGLRAQDLQACCAAQVPSNDAGIALGQAFIAAAQVQSA